MDDPASRLQRVLSGYDRMAVAVSGGVDSMTLAFCAAQWVSDFVCVHAVSPAVPQEATDRVRDHAKTYGWSLQLINSREFDDPSYISNPYNRCYFCKHNLYSRIGDVFDGVIASGTNLDDLEDYRPGLVAASESNVIHPFVEARINKAELRQIAHQYDLSEIADLPAQPCLASRVETGIAIAPDDLAFIHALETALSPIAGGADLRCRITHAGVRVEASRNLGETGRKLAEKMCVENGRVLIGVTSYKRGSAFVPTGQP